MSTEGSSAHQRIAEARGRVDTVRGRAERTLLWQVWDRMLEIEFVDRSVALAGKAFVSFFPLVIVVAAFVPPKARNVDLHHGDAPARRSGRRLATAKQAFASSDDIRRATGVLGLVLTFFFASSFTTALQRVYLRAWRRPPGGKVGEYTRGPAWLIAIIASHGADGRARTLLGDGRRVVAVHALISLARLRRFWWFTAWFLLLGQVRWRVLVPPG